MSTIKPYSWDAKPRTMLRYIKPGDLFALRLGEETYGFGRIISKVDLGHVAEFLDCILNRPELDDSILLRAKRLGNPVVLDSYSLFDRKFEGDWRVIGHHGGFIPDAVADTFFSYGAGADRWRVDVYGQERPVTAAEAMRYPPYTPKGDLQVKRDIFGLS